MTATQSKSRPCKILSPVYPNRPKNRHSTQPALRVPVLSQPHQRIVPISTGAARSLCEMRSGETRSLPIMSPSPVSLSLLPLPVLSQPPPIVVLQTGDVRAFARCGAEKPTSLPNPLPSPATSFALAVACSLSTPPPSVISTGDGSRFAREAEWRNPLLYRSPLPAQYVFCFCRCLFSLNPTKNRHFDRSSSRFCEMRSGETRFSTHTVSQPTKLLLLPLPVLSQPHQRIVISTGAARAFCEMRSGETRFSTHTVSQPDTLLLLPLPVLSQPHQRIVISTGAARAFASMRSGETRFSTHTVSRPIRRCFLARLYIVTVLSAAEETRTDAHPQKINPKNLPIFRPPKTNRPQAILTTPPTISSPQITITLRLKIPKTPCKNAPSPQQKISRH